MRLSDVGEFGLIGRLRGAVDASRDRTRGGRVVLGIGDDAAVLGVSRVRQLVATIDTLVEGVHFRLDWSTAEDLGWKSLAVNLSDLGAMGAEPLAVLVAIALPPDTDAEWVEQLYSGIDQCAERYGGAVVGGDTVRSPAGVMITVAALGTVPHGGAVLRSGARAGELLCVTGTLGESGAGLALLEDGHSGVQVFGRSGGLTEPCMIWHLRPEPPVEAGIALARAGLATAMMDLSDGLASDTQHLAERSGVQVVVQEERMPISDATRRAAAELNRDPVAWALDGGEDHQLLFTVPQERFAEVPPLLGPHGVVATIIGEVREGNGVRLMRQGAEKVLLPGGFTHFEG